MEQYDWINSRERFSVPNKKIEPKADATVSKIVGKTVLMLDPRLLSLVAKWKAGKDPNSMTPDNFLKDPKKIQELKEAFNKDL